MIYDHCSVFNFPRQQVHVAAALALRAPFATVARLCRSSSASNTRAGLPLSCLPGFFATTTLRLHRSWITESVVRLHIIFVSASHAYYYCISFWLTCLIKVISHKFKPIAICTQQCTTRVVEKFPQPTRNLGRDSFLFNHNC